MTKEQLRPCPFCGDTPKSNQYESGEKSFAWIECERCRIRREFNTEGIEPDARRFVSESIARWWNGRAVETKEPQ